MRMEPEAHGIAAVGPDLAEDAVEVSEIGCAWTDIRREISPGEIGPIEKKALVVETDPVGGLRPKALAREQYPKQNQCEPATA